MNTEIDILNAAAARLRIERAALLSAASILLDWGIGSHTEEVNNRLDELSIEAVRLGRQLFDLGAVDDALAATGNWHASPRKDIRPIGVAS
ncbi:hypothetical protein AB0K00_40115 [Dactylosporangium sp. NPDC049525]|uniref:hypothetical protein n=1 Tax=Dactylosporangium sp. NPDC049525 TaxID=3154730 RepID=UPI003449FFD1